MNAQEKKQRATKQQLVSMFPDAYVKVADDDLFIVAGNYNYDKHPDTWYIAGTVTQYASTASPMQMIVRNSFCNKEFSKFIDVLRKFDRDDVSEYVSGLISNAAVRYLEELFGDQVTLYVISYRKEKRGSGYIVSNTKTKILHISRDGTDITDITYAVSLACELKISKQFRWITQCCFADIQQAIRLHCCKCAVTMKFVLESK